MILEKYEGKNPYLKKLKIKLKESKGKMSLTQTQSKYILDNHDKEPILLNKVIEISDYLATELQKSNYLKILPKRILVEFVLGETDKTYHIYGKLKRNQEKSGMYFIPKTQILDDMFFEEVDVEVDFEKYTKLDQFVLKDGTIGRTPYEHQIKGIKFLLSRDGCILADDMGLGKTFQSIIAALESGAEKILIVCPSSVKINWEREIHYFQEYDTTIISGRKWSEAKFTIINYDILKNFHQLPDNTVKAEDIHHEYQKLVNANFDLCIIDEAHYLKNKNSKRGAIMAEVCMNIEKVWLLSGTPVANRPMDYFNLLKLIKSPLTHNWKFYATRYCEGRQITTKLKNGRTKKVWLTKGASNLDELAIKTKNIFLRRLKTEIKDMPEKIVIPTYHEFTNSQLLDYEGLWEEYLIERAEKKKRGVPDRELVELGLLRKYVAMQAVPETIKMAENMIEQGHKVIIFTNFTDELIALQSHFKNKSVIHYGEMSDNAKQNSVDNFQNNDKIRVFIGNIQSAGVGITLTQATYVIFNSFDWVPGNNEQAEDRAYRIGQTNNVTVYYQLFKAKGFDRTISESMWSTLQNKKDVIATIMGEKGIDEDAVLDLMLNEILEDE